MRRPERNLGKLIISSGNRNGKVTKTNKPSRLLLIGTTDQIGGTQRIIINLTRELRRRGWDVKNIIPNTPEAGLLVDWCRSQDVAIELGPSSLFGPVQRTIKTTLELYRFIKSSGYNNVNFHYRAGYIPLLDIVAARLARARCVASVHSLGPWKDRSQMIKTCVASYLCTKVVAVTGASRTRLMEAGIPQERIRVVPCGIAPPQQHPDRAQARASLQLRPEEFVVLTNARLVPEKGVEELIAAIKRLAGKSEPIRLVIVGDGPERARLQQLADTNIPGQALFLGLVHDVNSVYPAADIFALPTHMENCGLAFIEAAFHGIPSVGTSVGGLPEMVLNGKTGLLVPPKDPIELGNAILYLQLNPGLRQQMGNAAQARASELHTDAHMADCYIKLISR